MSGTETNLGRVSVVIPLYNHAAYITAALQSVVDQGPIVREVIVIDDGSRDDSLAIARDYAARHRTIRVFGQENQGAAKTINRGMAEAGGEFIAILNSDDLWETGRLTRLARALDLDAGMSLAASGIIFIDDAGIRLSNSWYDEALDRYVRQRDLGLSLMEGNFLMTTSNFLLRKELLGQIGGFADLRYAHDLDFCLRMQAHGKRIAFIDEPLLNYRTHGTNTIKEDHGNVRVDWAMVASFYLWRLTRSGRADRGRLAQGWAVLERHGLKMAGKTCIAYFDAYPTPSLAENPILADKAMKSTLLGEVS